MNYDYLIVEFCVSVVHLLRVVYLIVLVGSTA